MKYTRFIDIPQLTSNDPRPKAFHDEYLVTFSPCTSDHLCYDLWNCYHYLTETYDRTVCTGRIGPGGGILPTTSQEFGLMNRYARRVYRAISAIAGDHQIESPSLWSKRLTAGECDPAKCHLDYYEKIAEKSGWLPLIKILMAS